MTSRSTADRSAASVNDKKVYMVKLQCLLKKQNSSVKLDVEESTAEEITQVLHSILRHKNKDTVELVDLLLKCGANANQKLGKNRETALHVAAFHCHDPLVLRYLLDAGVSVNATTKIEKLTALHMAVKMYHRPGVEELLRRRGIRRDAQCRIGDTPLHMAVKRGSRCEEAVKIAQLLLDHRANPNCQNVDKETPFTTSLGKAQDQMSTLMLSKTAVKRVNVRLKNHDGETTLHLAAQRCSKSSVFEALLELSSPAARSDSSLVFYAMKNKNPSTRIELVRLLLENGDIDPRGLMVNSEDETLLCMAVSLKDVDLTKFFLESSNLDVNGEPGKKIPIVQALRNGDEASVNVLLCHDARVDLFDRQFRNQSSLQSAMAGFQDKGALFRVCKQLLDRGAPLDHIDADQQSALAAAMFGGHQHLANLLIARGANLHSHLLDGVSHLHIAVQRGLVDTAKNLLDSGMDANYTPDIAGRSVLHYAINADVQSNASVTLLLEYGANCRTDAGALVSALNKPNTDSLKLLLSHGADVNLQYEGKVLLAHAIGIRAPIESTGCLLEHIALLASQGRHVHKENLQLMKKSQHLQNIYSDCIGELDRMKLIKLRNSYITYFSLLTERHDSIARCSRYRNANVEVIPTFERYSDILTLKMQVGLRRLPLLEKLRELLLDVLGNRLPCEMIEIICQGFSDKELESFDFN